MPRSASQLSFKRHAGWGGRRAHAGRKPAGPRRLVPHLTRRPHATRHPVHVTLRAVDAVGSLREQPAFQALWGALAAASRPEFRVVHFSIQGNHVHLIIEAHDRTAFIRGVQGLAIRTARAVNRALGRHGKVWGDRYHARALTTPREVRNALVYVLQNWLKSVRGQLLDGCSTAPWFDGWKGPRPPGTLPPPGEPPPVRAPRTWLLREGWRRAAGGLIAFSERPRGAIAPP